MNITLSLLCLAALCGGGDEKDKPKLEVRVKATANVRGAEVTIGELCDVTPTGVEALAVAQVRFGPSPVAGHARTVSRTEILQALAAAGRDVGTLKFEGAAEVVVQPVLVEVPAQDLLDSATAALQAVLALEGGDVEYTAPARLRHVQAPPGRHSQELKARVRGGKTAPTLAVVEVDVLVDGAAWKTVPLQFQLTRYQPVLKTIGPVRAGNPLGADVLTVVREAVANTQNPFLGDLQQVVGLVAARNLQADQRLTLVDTALPALVHKGDIVTVVLTRGRVKVTAKALANHDAPLGGRLTLTNLQSRAQLTGMVSAPGLVVVQQ